MSAYSDQSEDPVVKLRSRNSNRDRDRSNRKSVVDQIKSNELHIIGHKKASFTSQQGCSYENGRASTRTPYSSCGVQRVRGTKVTVPKEYGF